MVLGKKISTSYDHPRVLYWVCFSRLPGGGTISVSCQLSCQCSVVKLKTLGRYGVCLHGFRWGRRDGGWGVGMCRVIYCDLHVIAGNLFSCGAPEVSGIAVVLGRGNFVPYRPVVIFHMTCLSYRLNTGRN